MSQAKIAFQIGQLSYSSEGSEDWVATQLENFIAKLPSISGFTQMEPTDREVAHTPTSVRKPEHLGSLASYLKAKGADKNQTRRFLATADWLRLKGERNLKTSLVSKALQDNHQKRLANASESLNRNVSQGFCEKTSGGGFFITPEGIESLSSASTEPEQAENSDVEATPKKKRRVVRQPPPGSSCRDRIKTLKADGFFKQRRSTTDIVAGLAKKGWTHNSKQVGAALTIMFDKGELQRTKEDGAFEYFWDRD